MYTLRDTCRGCNSSKIKTVLNLGNMPLAGGFLYEKDIHEEKVFPLTLVYCEECTLVQVPLTINSDILFKDYRYISSVIGPLSQHFQEYADFLRKTYLSGQKRKLLEFGCNDGVFLEKFLGDQNIFVIGVDPSENVSAMARERGINVLTEYFTRTTAEDILKEHGTFDVVTGSNVFAHTDDIHEIVKAAKTLLSPDGVFIVEVHYLKDLLKSNQYDTIYHEHMMYYSVTALKNILKRDGMRLIDVQHLPMHGGAIRVISAKEESSLKTLPTVAAFITTEKDINEKSLTSFGKFCENHRLQLQKLIKNLKDENKSIAGYGAPGRGTILLNYCNLGKDDLSYVTDISPLRINRLIPGVHIPIINIIEARNNPPDYFLVLAWNYAESILHQESALLKAGIKFIIPFPDIKIVDVDSTQ